ncbi:MAG: peptidoglycan recognition family protein [Solirubrobacteraceae bacterium]
MRRLAVAVALAIAAAGVAGAVTGVGADDRAVAAPVSGATGVSGSTGATVATTPSLAPLLGPPPIVKDMIPFGAVRKNQMREYALLHYGIDSYTMPHPHLVIWHYTETSTASSVWNTFANDVPDVEYHALPQVCAQFVIDPAGTIYQLVPIHIMCRQVVGLDYTAVGIENVGFSDQQVMDDAAQYHAALELTRWLRCTLGIPVRNVIGHNESLSSPYYLEHVASWRGQTHQDFNHADMNVVRARVAKLPCRAASG